MNDLQSIALEYKRRIAPFTVCYSQPSTVDKAGAILVGAAEGPLVKLRADVLRFSQWAIEDFGIYHFSRFKQRPAVAQWLDKHRETLEGLAEVPPKASLQRLAAGVAALAWLDVDSRPFQTEDSMLPEGQVVGIPRLHPTTMGNTAIEQDVVEAWAAWDGSSAERRRYLSALRDYLKWLSQR